MALPFSVAVLRWTCPSERRISARMSRTWDYVSGFTPTEPTYPAPGEFLYQGTVVNGPSATNRFKLSIPVYSGYTYEIYGDPTLADLEWKALPFSLTPTGTLVLPRPGCEHRNALSGDVKSRS